MSYEATINNLGVIYWINLILWQFAFSLLIINKESDLANSPLKNQENDYHDQIKAQ